MFCVLNRAADAIGHVPTLVASVPPSLLCGVLSVGVIVNKHLASVICGVVCELVFVRASSAF